jgi:hypothetical protein
MLKTPFRAQTMEGLYRKVMKGKYPEINKKYSNQFDFVISNMLKLKPEERPTTGDILKIPEIISKIQELQIFPLCNNNLQMNTIASRKSRNYIPPQSNSSFQSIKNNNRPTSSNISMGMAKNMSKNSIEQSIYETENNNNISKSNVEQKYDSITNINNSLSPITPRKVNKSEILEVLNNNLNYFNQKKNEEKFILNTIRLPKTLGKLNDKLPASQYESEYIKKRKNFQGLSFPNKALPMLKVRYNSNEHPNPEQENNKNVNSNSKTIELNPPTLVKKNNIDNNKRYNDGNLFLAKGKHNYLERNNRFINKFNTIKMLIDKKKPFNYKGQIDIIVEE